MAEKGKLKVALVGPFPEPGARITGGVARVIDCLVRQLQSDVELNVFVPGAGQTAVVEHAGVPVHYLKRRPWQGLLRYSRSDAKALRAALDAFRPDLVHLHCASGVGRYLTGPAILTVHGILERDLVEKAGAHRFRRLAAAGAARWVAGVERIHRQRLANAIVITPYMRDALPDLANLNTVDIPNPISPLYTEGEPAPACARERLIVAVQRIGPLKNTLGLLKIACCLMARASDVRLVICGAVDDPKYFALCREQVRSAGMEDRVEFAGVSTESELVALLDRAACFVTCSRQETAPMVVAEALARGVPVVGPNAFGLRYMISAGRNGDFWQGEDVAANATLLDRALCHSWDHERIAREARALHDSGRVAARTLAAYQSVLNRKPLDA